VDRSRDVSQTFVVRYAIVVGGERITIEESEDTLTVRDDTTYTLNLSDFIPGGVDPESIDPAFLTTSGSAWLLATADVLVDDDVVESALAPRIYGHAHDGETLKIYRKAAMDTYYCGGDLAGCRAGGTTQDYSGRASAWGVAP
jgi:hypothetical protein